LRPSTVCAARQYSQALRLAIATAICSPSRAGRAPPPSAPKAPHIDFSAAGELATARNMFGVAPKAAWISDRMALRSAVVSPGFTRGIRDMACAPLDWTPPEVAAAARLGARSGRKAAIRP